MRRLHDFHGMTVVTYLHPDGYYVAHERDMDLSWTNGQGDTREAAIDDFADQLDAKGLSR